MFPAGGLVGSSIAGYLLNKFGRKNNIMITHFGFIVGTLLAALSKTQYELAIGRFIVGFMMGINSCAVSIYVVEISPVRIRGIMGCIPQIAFNTGTLLSAVFSFYFSDLNSWRFFLASPALVSLVYIMLGWFMVESPKFLELRGDLFGAQKSYSKLFGSNAIYTPQANKETIGISVFQLLRDKRLRKSMILNFMLQFMQQFIGINAIYYYSTSIIDGFIPGQGALGTVILQVIGLVMVLLGSFIIERFGRRKLLITSITLTLLSMILFLIAKVTGNGTMALICLFLYVLNFCLGLASIPWLVMAEVFPTYAVSAGASVGCALNWAMTMIVSATFPSLSNWLQDYVFIPYIMAGFISLVFSIIWVPETKNKTTEEIIAEINK